MKDGDILHESGDPRLQGGRLYSMMDLLGASITCDHCRRWQRLSGLIETDARADAEAKGWTMAERDLCPVCSAAPDDLMEWKAP